MIPVVQLMPAFKDLFPDDNSEYFEYLPEPELKGLDDPVIILHSSGASGEFGLRSAFMMTVLLSGSVAFPKPITFTNRIWVCYSRLLWYGGRDMCGTVISGHAVPVFHGMGLSLLWFTVRQVQGSCLEGK